MLRKNQSGTFVVKELQQKQTELKKEHNIMFFAKKKENTAEKLQAGNQASQSAGKKKEIIILGLGCVKCNEMENNTKKAVQELNISEEVRHVTDLDEIVSYGVFSIPALVIDGTVISTGKVLSVNEIKEVLKQHRPM